MSRRDLERFLFRFDKEPDLQAAFAEEPAKAFTAYDLSEDEKTVLAARDVATLYEWGLHPLLVRNFAGTLGVRYVGEYRRRGLT